MVQPNKARFRARGFTLIEAIIALSILLLVSLSFFASLLASSRSAQVGRANIYAIQLMDRILEELRAADFDNLGNTVTGAAENRFNSNQTFNLQIANAVNLPYTVSCKFLGFGTVASATATSLTPNFPANYPAWTTDQWKGRAVVVTDGVAKCCMAYVNSNTANTLTISRNLDGSGGGGWWTTPVAGDTYLIDNGKSVQVTITWTVARKAFTMTRTTLIPDPTT